MANKIKKAPINEVMDKTPKSKKTREIESNLYKNGLSPDMEKVFLAQQEEINKLKATIMEKDNLLSKTNIPPVTDRMDSVLKKQIDQKDAEIKSLKAEIQERQEMVEILSSLLEQETKTVISPELLKTVNLPGARGVTRDKTTVAPENLSVYKLAFNKVNEKLLSLNAEKEKIKAENVKLNQKMQATFNAADLSTYLFHAVDSFNLSSKAKEIVSGVNYIISGMDVEMKALVGNDQDEMKLMTPSMASEGSAALSTIKFSIRPVPNDPNEDK